MRFRTQQCFRFSLYVATTQGDGGGEGADAAAGNIPVAQVHAAQSGLEIDYRHTTAEALADHNPPVLASTIGQRVVFADAAQTGRLASDINRQSHAAREIAALTSEIGRLGLGKVAV